MTSHVKPSYSVLLLHNRYQERGGEDSVLEAEAALLESRGHTVWRLLFDNAGIRPQRSLRDSAGLALSTVWSRSAAAQVRTVVRQYRPDIVHVHNTFPLASPSVYSACRQEGAAVVQTLHNYRLVCPNALFFRDGHPCEDCLGKTPPWPGVLHACYRGSRAQTAVVAAMLTAHRLRGTWQKDVDLYIALSEFSRQRFIAGGLPADLVVRKTNFLPTDPPPRTTDGDYLLYVGRLAEGKGITTLLKAAELTEEPVPVRIAGGGPLASLVRREYWTHRALNYLGLLPPSAVLEQMRGARALVFPSLLYENFPMTIVEAFASGLPVIASRGGAVGEIVDDGRTGILFTPGDDRELAAKLTWAWQHPAELRRMGEAARHEFEQNYTADHGYRNLLAVYDRARSRARSRG